MPALRPFIQIMQIAKAPKARKNGTRLLAVIGPAEGLLLVNSSPAFVPAAMNAVRQWRCSQTLLAGQSVETEEDVAVVFRLSNPPAPER